MVKDTSEKSAERYFAIQKSREESKRKRALEVLRRRCLSSDIRYWNILNESLRNFSACISWAAALTITEDTEWREKLVTKITETAASKCDVE